MPESRAELEEVDVEHDDPEGTGTDGLQRPDDRSRLPRPGLNDIARARV